MNATIGIISIGSHLLTMGVGYWLARVTRKRGEAKYVDPEPICGCGHHLAMHYRKDGEVGCDHVETRRVLAERGQPKAVGSGYAGQEWKTVYAHERWETQTTPCRCKDYTGPEYYPKVIA